MYGKTLPLFIKKNNDEGMDFYYMGDVISELNRVEQTTMRDNKGKQIPVVKIRFNLKSPVSAAMYNYLQENLKITKLKAEKIEKKHNVVQLEVFNELSEELRNLIPLYDFYAAAGAFSEMQSEKNCLLIEGPKNMKPNTDYFACKIIGESMNRVIPNGSICLFKAYTGGSRDGKIVLVENRDMQDQDFNSAFTIKTYSSEKDNTAEGWEHTSIVLRPNSFDESYKNIIINKENAEGMRVIGEFVSVLGNSEQDFIIS